MQRYILEAQKRENTGKSKALRRENMVPAEVYGAHIDNQHLVVPYAEVEKFIKHRGPGSTFDLVVDGKTSLTLFKSMQHHPVNQRVMHMDFQALKADEKIKVSIPVTFHVSEHLKNVMVQELLYEIEIMALPEDLVSHVTVEVLEAAAGESKLLSDLEIAKNSKIEVLTDLDTLVYNVVETKEFVEPEAEASEVPATEETSKEE